MKKNVIFLAMAALLSAVACTTPGDKFKPGNGSPYESPLDQIMMTGTDNNPMVKISVGDNPPATYNVSVSATSRVSSDITVNLKVGDEEALANYNKTRGTNYQLVDPKNYVFDATSMVIKAGTAFSESIPLTIPDFSFIKNGVSYMIPITITSVSGTSMSVLESSRTIYIRLARTITFYSLSMDNTSLYSNYVFPEDKAIDLPQYTYEIKCYPTDLKSDGAEQLCRLCNWTGPNEERQCMLRFNENGRPWRSLQIVTPSGGDYTTTTLFDEDQWYMLSIVYDGSTFQLYINGEPDATTLTSNEVTKFQRFEVGMSWTGYRGSQRFAGRICEVRVWDYPRSKAQIKADLCSSDPEAEGLRAYWRMNQNEGTTFIDESGHGYDMDWTKSQREVTEGQGLVPTPDAAGAISWIKDEINACTN